MTQQWSFPSSFRTALNTMAAVGVSLIFLTPMCGVLFRCGCAPLWSTAVELCNIHQEAVAHCPWCTSTASALMGALASVTVVVGASFTRRPWAPWVAIVPGYLLAGLFTFLATDYPHFIVKNLR